MKSICILIIFCGVSIYGFGQDFLGGNAINRGLQSLPNSFRPIGDPAKTKWSYSTYAGISSGFIGWRGGSAAIFAAPVGLQLNRQLNNNLFAFAGVSTAPTLIYSSNNFIQQDFNKTAMGSVMRNNAMHLQSRAEIGLMYVNDERTFSISGSVGIDRRTNPFAGQLRNSAFTNTLNPTNR